MDVFLCLLCFAADNHVKLSDKNDDGVEPESHENREVGTLTGTSHIRHDVIASLCELFHRLHYLVDITDSRRVIYGYGTFLSFKSY